CFGACRDEGPGFAWPRLLRSVAAMELKEFAEARADLDRVLRDPPDPQAAHVALVTRGALAIRRQRWDEAIADLERAVKASPEDYAAHVNLARAHRQRAEVPPWQSGALLLAPRGALALLAWEAHRREARQRAVAVLDQ